MTKPRRTVAETRSTLRAKDGGPKLPDAFAKANRAELRRWATITGQRDDMIVRAYRSGIGINELARLSTLAKTTIIRALREAGEL